MSFIVTARKWRPQKFSEVAGQEHITATLKNAIKNNRIAHAYLFTGPRGVGKTTTARILAKTLNCLNQIDSEPCGECEMCVSIQSTQSLDIIEIDGASNRGIDEVRTLRDSVKYAPTKGKYKVYIIDEVHMLTRESFNAFLKTLEEPPAHTIFIFATTDVHKVPLTIISRCQRFDFRRIQLGAIKSVLSEIAKEEKIKIDDKTLTIIAKKADGALRDAESFFDQVVSFCANKIDSETVAQMLNLIDDEIYFRISDAVLNKDYKEVFQVSTIIYENGWDFLDFMDGLVEHFRNIMSVIATEKTDLIETADAFKANYMNYLGQFSEGDLLRILNFLNKTQQELKYTQNQKLKIEISLSHLIGLEKSSTINEIISEIDNPKEASKQLSFTSVQSEKKNYISYNTINEVRESRSSRPKINKKEPVKTSLPEINNRRTFDFNSIVEKWEGFVTEINNERSLTLGHLFESIKPINLDGNKLQIYSDDSNAEDTLKLHDDYISKKSYSFFGKKLMFQIEKNPSEKIENPQIKQTLNPEIKKETEPSDDPYVNAIINELGGEKIS